MLISLTVTIFLSAHVAGCFWYFQARVMGLGPGTWPFENHIDIHDKTTLYFQSLHWSVQTLVTVGFGDIVAFNHGELPTFYEL